MVIAIYPQWCGFREGSVMISTLIFILMYFMHHVYCRYVYMHWSRDELLVHKKGLVTILGSKRNHR